MNPAEIRRHVAELGDPATVLANFLAFSPFPIQVYRRDGRCLFVNGPFVELFGSAPPAAYSVFDDEVAAGAGIAPLIRRAFAGETVQVPPVWYDPRDLRHVDVREGRRVAIEANFVPLGPAGSGVEFVLVLFRDHTEEMRAKEERDELLVRERQARAEADKARQRLAALVDQAPASISLHRGRDLTFVLSNARHQETTRHRSVIGRPFEEALPELSGQEPSERLKRVLETGEPYVASELPVSIVDASGARHQRFFDVTFQPVRPAGEQVEEVLAFSYDVTDKVFARRRVEQLAEALRASEERFRVVQEKSPDGFMMFRSIREEGGAIVDFEWVYTNPAGERLVGKRHEELVGQRLLTVMPGNKAEGLFDAYVRVVQTGGVYRRELSYLHDGIARSFRVLALRLEDGFAATFEDITDRRRAEKERDELLARLEQGEARLASRLSELATLFDVVPIGLCVSDDLDCREIRMNPAMARLVRQPVDRNISLSAPAGVRPVWRVYRGHLELTAADLPIQRAARGELVHDRFVVVIEDGMRIEFEAFAAPLVGVDGQITGSVAAFVDITERTRAEHEREALLRQLDEDKRLLDAILDAMPVGLLIAQAEGGGVRTNKAHEAIWGAAQPGGQTRARLGRWATTGRPLASDDWPITRAFAHGELVPGELVEIERLDGSGCRLVLSMASPVRSADGGVVAAVGAELDVTERVRAEEALKEADRRKDEFIATLAHELRNPLAPLRTGLAVLKRVLDDPARATRTLEMMERQLAHMVRLVDDLLDVSRISRGRIELRRQRVSLRTLVSSAEETSRPFMDARGHELSVTLSDEPLLLDVDATRFAQILGNLLTNAAKYTPDKGHIRLVARDESRDVVISVSDTGVGIPKEMLGKVFEMFTQVDSMGDQLATRVADRFSARGRAGEIAQPLS